MTLKSTPLFIFLISISLFCLSVPAYSQMCAGQSKTSITTTGNLTEKSKTTSTKKVKIRVPVNYRPPLANEKLITFPETIATKKKQKKLLRKRKRNKKKGCIAANM
jgi:hypothetical protein